jgi:beta-lactam-binding protein with PASTA domain
MPDVMCMNLQDAQDLIQEQGVFLSLSQDATGQDRMQVLDSNWQVVGQLPAPGTPIDEGDAMLDVVKYGESSPCS